MLAIINQASLTKDQKKDAEKAVKKILSLGKKQAKSCIKEADPIVDLHLSFLSLAFKKCAKDESCNSNNIENILIES